jgi:hypothetical protein
MAKYRITAPDGGTYEVTAPDTASEAEVLAYAQQNYQAKPKAEAKGDGVSAGRVLSKLTPAGLAASLATTEGREDVKSAGMGFARGMKDVVDTGAELLASGYDRITGNGSNVSSLVTGQSSGEAARVRQMNAAGKADYAQQYGDNGYAGASRIAGNVAATLPVGPVLGAGAKAVGLTRLGNALASGGMTTGAQVAPNLLARAVDMGTRMAGGAGTGYVSAGLVDPEAANTGAAVGAVLPPVAAVAGRTGELAGSLVRPFTKKGQERIAGDALRQFATNADEAAASMRASGEVVPGSMPTAVMASGDEGLAGLSRTLQSADPRYAAELSSRMSAQNAARTSALEGVAGNTGKLALAKEARDAATGPMRETVLDAAGKFEAKPVLDSIDRLLSKPDNAGKLSQQALNSIKNQIAGVPNMHGKRVGGLMDESGLVDARALYAIRKDINDILGGKLQGEAGNLRYAAGQLTKVKGLIDDAIDQASRRVQMSSSRALMPAGANIERAGMAPAANAGPRPTWQGYLDEYTQRSIPINQMEKLDEVMNRISTGTVDKSGNAVLSAAKLNNLLRNEAKDLQKALAPEQLDLLRRLAADLNASQLAANSGKAVGSNTVQNLAGTNVLAKALGDKMGGSATAQSVLGRLLQLPYGSSNRMIQDKLGNALLDPKEAARLMATPEGNALRRALSGEAAQIGYRAAPALSAR